VVFRDFVAYRVKPRPGIIPRLDSVGHKVSKHHFNVVGIASTLINETVILATTKWCFETLWPTESSLDLE
jgi:hypothetical protein